MLTLTLILLTLLFGGGSYYAHVSGDFGPYGGPGVAIVGFAIIAALIMVAWKL